MEEDDDANIAIKKLNDDSIRRIVAEQAITDLSSIVKELVDNAIDAESTTIKIRLFGHGLEIIEVSDDGCGVPLNSRDQLATRYATSKIRSFEDIYSGTGLSMGFRGEALFSMACLSSQLVVASRTESEDVAQKLQFHRDGSLDKSSVTAVHRKVGTTVAVVAPFAHLPARRADMTRRIRAERSKLFRLMESYAIFNVGVAINLIDIVSGREDVALATSSTSSTLEENVSAVMGHKFLSTLAPIDINLGSVVAPNEGDNIHDWGIKGLLSRTPQDHPPSRSITCFCVNGRVVQLPKVAALLRKLWTGFAGRKKPSCILSFTLPNCSFDINLSPDKQQVLLLNEEHILDVISRKISDFYSSQVNGKFSAKLLEQPGTEEIVEKERQKHKRRFAFVHDLSKAKLQHDLEDRESTKRQKLEHQSSISFPKDQGDINKLCGENENQRYAVRNAVILGSREEELTNNRLVANKEKVQSNGHGQEKPGEIKVGRKQPKSKRNEGEQRSEKCDPPAALTSENDDSTDTLPNRENKNSSLDKRGRHPGFRSTKNQKMDSDTKAIRQNARLTDYERQKWTEIQSKFRADQRRVDIETARSNVTSTKTLSPNSSFEDSIESNLKDRQEQFEEECSTSKRGQNRNVNPSENDLSGPNSKMPPTSGGKGETGADSRKPSAIGQKSPLHTSGERPVADINELNSATPKDRSSTCLHWASFMDTDRICSEARFERVVLQKRRKDSSLLHRVSDEAFRIPDDKSESCRRETSQSLQPDKLSMSKAKFRGGMKVLGQFNLGFILCICNESNIWIFDQHACDERYNFEKLRRETKMHEQKLLKPMMLELTSSEEACILDHMDVFESNCFRFEFRPMAPIRRRLLLTALPHSGAQEGRKAVQFDQEDVKALCAMLSEGASYDAGDGGTGTDGSGKFGNNAVRYASMASSQQDQGGNLIARLPKAISMFASRSCRSSIMIGTALSHKEMKKIVSRLADVEFPWTCPHGRPTLRHVGNVSTVVRNDEDQAVENKHL